MSGGRVPYHLRTSKAIDRHLFVDVLLRFNAYKALTKYTYVGFGGPFLEDFRLVHDRLGLTKLVSIESDPSVFNRQKFNRPLSNIDCRLTTSGDFITEYNIKKQAIVWLDYANAKEQRAQLEEMQLLLSKLRSDDVLKVTLNANPETLGGGGKKPEERRAQRKNRVKQLMGDLLPNEFDEEDADTPKGFAGLLLKATIRAAHEALAGKPKLKFLPLTGFRYADSANQMVTMTGVLINRTREETFFARTGLRDWDLALNSSLDPIPIDVPSLSVRERLFVDARLPELDGKRMTEALGFLCADDEDDSAQLLDSYRLFYRHLPYFSRIVP